MTRNEAQKQVNEAYIGTHSDHFHLQLINRIYDDFKNRTCESCASKVDHGFGWVRCGKLGTIFRNLDFGCNEWEQK